MTKSKLDLALEALTEISKFFVSYDAGRFGAIVNADVTRIAQDCLKEIAEMKEEALEPLTYDQIRAEAFKFGYNYSDHVGHFTAGWKACEARLLKKNG